MLEADHRDDAPDPEPGCRTTGAQLDSLGHGRCTSARESRRWPRHASRRTRIEPPRRPRPDTAHARRSTPLDGSASDSLTRLGPDRVVAIGRRRHRARRLGHQRARPAAPARRAPDRRHDRRRRTVPRIAVGGGAGLERTDPIDQYDEHRADGRGLGVIDPGISAADVRDPSSGRRRHRRDRPRARRSPRSTGPFLDDGTLLKPVAVDTTVADGIGLMRTYKVKAGDTLTGIAAQVRRLDDDPLVGEQPRAKDELHVGQVLTIPPVSGLVVTVEAGDTLDTLAAKYKVDAAEIIDANELDGPEPRRRPGPRRPGRQGRRRSRRPSRSSTPAVSRPRAAAAAAARPRPPTQLHRRHASPGRSSGRQLHQPVLPLRPLRASTSRPTTATRVTAGGGGTVIFAGWKNNGGGYQVWIAHGSGLYTTYNHMSRDHRSGAASTSGAASRSAGSARPATPPGPHLHFEVWRGPVWNGGTRVNPLAYL